MKKVTFKGTFAEVNKQAVEWERANPRAKIIDKDGPRGTHNAIPGRSLCDDPNWTITFSYEDPTSN
jgi:hypothetical protein